MDGLVGGGKTKSPYVASEKRARGKKISSNRISKQWHRNSDQYKKSKHQEPFGEAAPEGVGEKRKTPNGGQRGAFAGQSSGSMTKRGPREEELKRKLVVYTLKVSGCFVSCDPRGEGLKVEQVRENQGWGRARIRL